MRWQRPASTGELLADSNIQIDDIGRETYDERYCTIFDPDTALTGRAFAALAQTRNGFAFTST